MLAGPLVILDDRLLIEELLVGLDAGATALSTTTYWYYRACRAAALGAGGHLSGPFQQLDDAHQRAAITSLLELRDDIALPDPRRTVPAMASMATRHPRLNLLDLEAVAFGRTTGATVWMSQETANGVLPAVLDAEDIAWCPVAIE